MSSYYSDPYRSIRKKDIRTLTMMYSGMIANKARERIHRIEELSFTHMKAKEREKFLKMLYTQIDSSYKDERAVDEDELKRILGNVGYKPSN